MKVTGISAPPALGAGTAARTAAGGFAPAAAAGAPEAASTARGGATSGLTSLDALLALQETPSAAERRRRAVRRAGLMLDALDSLRLQLVDGGEAGADGLARLHDALGSERGRTDDPRLEEILDQIETRVAVELAKQQVAAGRA